MIEIITRQSPYSRKSEENVLKITDKNNNSFFMEVGGNLDLYWIPENDLPNDELSGVQSFEFEIGDEFFEFLKDAFSKIRKKDNPYSPTLTQNVFTFISEDAYGENEANILQITQLGDKFILDLIKPEPQSLWGAMKRGYSICFCNSGSRHPDIEQIFKKKFLELAYGYKFLEPGE